MQPDSFIENGAPLPLVDARYSGLSAGVPGTVARLGARAAQVRHLVAAPRRCGRRSGRRAQGLRHRRTFNEQAQDNAAYFDDIRSSKALYLDPDGTAHDVGTIQRNPDMARAYRRIARRGADGFYRGPIAARSLAPRTQPPLDARRRPRSGGPA